MIKIEGKDFAFQSLEAGTVNLTGEDEEERTIPLSEIAHEDQKLIMERTGWGRVWEDKSGKHHTVADLVEVVEDAIVLEKVDGKRIVIALDKLSKRDRKYAEARRTDHVGLPERFQGKVVGVHDGDTVTVLLNRRQHKVRLGGIDSPERGQAFGTKSKKHLANLVHGKTVDGIYEETDRYGRSICRLEIDGKRVDYEMLRTGLAWHHSKYSSDQKRQDYEDQARAAKLNIWSESGPIPPWEWRKWGSDKRRQYVEDKSKKTDSAANTTTTSAGISSLTSSRGDDTTTTVSASSSAELTHWLNTNGNVRHNRNCRWCKNTKRGRMCGPNEGRACGKCGG